MGQQGALGKGRHGSRGKGRVPGRVAGGRLGVASTRRGTAGKEGRVASAWQGPAAQARQGLEEPIGLARQSRMAGTDRHGSARSAGQAGLGCLGLAGFRKDGRHGEGRRGRDRRGPAGLWRLGWAGPAMAGGPGRCGPVSDRRSSMGRAGMGGDAAPVMVGLAGSARFAWSAPLGSAGKAKRRTRWLRKAWIGSRGWATRGVARQGVARQARLARGGPHGTERQARSAWKG